MTNEHLRQYALRRLKAKNDLKTLTVVWVGVAALVTVVWSLNGGGDFWPIWPMLGVGIAVFVAAMNAYGPRLGLVTEQDVDAEVQRLQKG